MMIILKPATGHFLRMFSVFHNLPSSFLGFVLIFSNLEAVAFEYMSHIKVIISRVCFFFSLSFKISSTPIVTFAT